MEFEIEKLISDLGLPRDVIQEDIEKGRLLIYQHSEDSSYYVDAEVFLEYVVVRVTELRKDQQRVFWLALQKMITDNPETYSHLSPEEKQAVLQGIQREIDNTRK